MSLTRINQNISSLNAQRMLVLNSERVGRSIERLSSGFRINRGADDPAGLVMSEILRTEVSGLAVAQQNALQGVNLIKTAEGALDEVSGLLRQIRDLAISASSDSNLNDDARTALQAQVTSALTTIDQIANNTAYAGVNLLDGSAGTASEINDITHIDAAALSGITDTGWVGVNVTTAAEQAVADTQVALAAMTTATTFEGIDAGWDNSLTGATTLFINGTQINVTDSYAYNTTMGTVITDVNAAYATTGVKARINTTTDKLELYTVNWGGSTYVAAEFVHGTAPASFDILDGAGSTFEADTGVSAVATVTLPDATTPTFTGGGTTGLVLANATYGSITIDDETAAGGANRTDYNNANAIYVTGGQLSFQVGIHANQTATTTIDSVATSQLGATTGTAMADIDISTVSGASDALAVIDQAIYDISMLRGDLGAFQVNELEAQARALAVARENLAASESTIRDTDFGSEMAEFTTAQIMVQSAIAFLAQANALPQNVLMLIQG